MKAIWMFKLLSKLRTIPPNVSFKHVLNIGYPVSKASVCFSFDVMK